MKKLLFIINPNSGKRGSKNGLINALNTFSAAGYQVEVYCTQRNGDCIKKCKEEGSNYDVVVVSGGDGTMNEATNGLMQCDKKPLIGYIPTGTMNDFAQNFNLEPSFTKTSKKIVSGRCDTFDVGNINGRYFNYVVGIGAFTSVAYTTDRELKENIGDAAYVLTGIGELGNLHPFKVKMTMDEEIYEGNAGMVLITNSYRVSGMAMVERKEGQLSDGLFDVIIVEWADNPIDQLASPIKLIHPEWKDDPIVRRYQAANIKIETEEYVEWTIDGEKGDKTKVANITNIPGALKILY